MQSVEHTEVMDPVGAGCVVAADYVFIIYHSIFHYTSSHVSKIAKLKPVCDALFRIGLSEYMHKNAFGWFIYIVFSAGINKVK